MNAEIQNSESLRLASESKLATLQVHIVVYFTYKIEKTPVSSSRDQYSYSIESSLKVTNGWVSVDHKGYVALECTQEEYEEGCREGDPKSIGWREIPIPVEKHSNWGTKALVGCKWEDH